MLETAVLKLRSYGYYNYRYVYFAAYVGTSVHLLDKSQFSFIKQIKACISILMHYIQLLNNR